MLVIGGCILRELHCFTVLILDCWDDECAFAWPFKKVEVWKHVIKFSFVGDENAVKSSPDDTRRTAGLTTWHAIGT